MIKQKRSDARQDSGLTFAEKEAQQYLTNTNFFTSFKANSKSVRNPPSHLDLPLRSATHTDLPVRIGQTTSSKSLTTTRKHSSIVQSISSSTVSRSGTERLMAAIRRHVLSPAPLPTGETRVSPEPIVRERLDRMFREKLTAVKRNRLATGAKSPAPVLLPELVRRKLTDIRLGTENKQRSPCRPARAVGKAERSHEITESCRELIRRVWDRHCVP